MATVLALAPPEEVGALLSTTRGLDARLVGTPAELLQAIDAAGERIDVLVTGPSVDAPLVLVQRAHQRQPEVSVVLLVPPEQLEPLNASLAISPFVGPDDQCLSAAQPAAGLVDRIRRVAEATELRRRHHAVLTSMSVKLASAPALETQPLGMLDRLFELAPIGILAIGERDEVLIGNQGAAEIFGSTPEALAGAPVASLVGPVTSATVAALLARVRVTGGGPQIRETIRLDGGGGQKVLEMRAASLGTPTGQRLVLALVEDVTDRSTAERERTRLIEQLDAAVQARDEFLSVASHELKTPLTSLLLQLQMLRRTQEGVPDGAERLAVSVRQVERLAALVENLLDVSRVTTGKLNLDLVELELGALVRDTTERLHQLFEQAGCPLTLTIEGEIRGRWDAFRLDQVVVNLLSNAAKYGAGKPIQVTVRADGPRALVRVRDEGIGMEPDQVPRLFERFARGVSDRHYGGLGLGLFITQEIVAAMGGEIRVETAPGKGATFEVSLPRTPGTGQTATADRGSR